MPSMTPPGAASAGFISDVAALSISERFASVRIALPTFGQLAPTINLLINVALAAFLVYILIDARKGR